jgi:hypothetical protein
MIDSPVQQWAYENGQQQAILNFCENRSLRATLRRQLGRSVITCEQPSF